MLFPPKILKMRINTSIKHFYDDLKVYCIRMNWEFVEPTQKQTEKENTKIYQK